MIETIKSDIERTVRIGDANFIIGATVLHRGEGGPTTSIKLKDEDGDTLIDVDGKDLTSVLLLLSETFSALQALISTPYPVIHQTQMLGPMGAAPSAMAPPSQIFNR